MDYLGERKEIKDLLMERQGKKNAIKRKDLWILFPALNDRQLRQIIEDLISEEGMPIASSGSGYYHLTSFEELIEAKIYLEEKAEAIAIRKNTLRRNFILWHRRQRQAVKAYVQGANGQEEFAFGPILEIKDIRINGITV